ncbi:hypothetical protein SERLADRAFT_446663 [Serpula lacrymans var. lacrymans S7.9]|uniref:C3H1-type domain-containing protein n=1 Tax=Serpula lacrymans var. lacrymans (strain S7.9) TaxID=578457 RepID=F8NMN8_SERL9|nr:uncharacterized protein SERLADRAFT_446663 [Serpula lacrymans var. lacrymans S7.9]EGO27435.1 hypothetical protein SERLADRAFT_446663 [Serpula lacrymans var. lacrymans S7.9]
MVLKRTPQLRVTELEVELAVWKQAHATALESSEREAKTLGGQLATLNRQIVSMENFMTHNLLILCIIDADECLFTESLLKQGHNGGRHAAQQITKCIAEYLTNEDVHILGHLSFWISIYYNKRGLVESLISRGICSLEQFEAFVAGFSQASPRFVMVDVGVENESTSTKIKEYLQTYIRFPQTQRVFFAGGKENTYALTFNSLENDQLLGKLVMLHGRSEDASDMRKYRFPIVRSECLSTSQRLLSSKNPSPLAMNGLVSSVTDYGLPTPCSPPRSTSSSTETKPLDPSLPLHKHSPPPCNEYYLMSCSKGGACKYSHSYILTPDQLATLAINAKKAPCNFLKNGLLCPYGDRCCWGHTCPNGPKCFHLSKGKCWFKGESMHSLELPALG